MSQQEMQLLKVMEKLSIKQRQSEAYNSSIELYHMLAIGQMICGSNIASLGTISCISRIIISGRSLYLVFKIKFAIYPSPFELRRCCHRRSCPHVCLYTLRALAPWRLAAFSKCSGLFASNLCVLNGEEYRTKFFTFK